MQKKRPNERFFFSPLAEQTTPLVAQGEYSKPRAVLLRAECCWIMLFRLLILIIPAARGILIRAECCQHCRQLEEE